MKKGDRIRLSDRAASSFSAASRGRHKVDWHERRGTVVRTWADQATVQWDGRSTLDQWPLQALTVVGILSPAEDDDSK